MSLVYAWANSSCWGDEIIAWWQTGDLLISPIAPRFDFKLKALPCAIQNLTIHFKTKNHGTSKKRKAEFDPQELLAFLRNRMNWTSGWSKEIRRGGVKPLLSELVRGEWWEPFHQKPAYLVGYKSREQAAWWKILKGGWWIGGLRRTVAAAFGAQKRWTPKIAEAILQRSFEDNEPFGGEIRHAIRIRDENGEKISKVKIDQISKNFLNESIKGRCSRRLM